MHIVIAVVVSLLVGGVCGYAFRGWISREKNAIGGEISGGLSSATGFLNKPGSPKP